MASHALGRVLDIGRSEPARPALRSSFAGEITYGELERRARTAAELQLAAGLGSGDRVLHTGADPAAALVWLFACSLADTVLVPVSGANPAWADVVARRTAARARTTEDFRVTDVACADTQPTGSSPPADLRAIVLTSGSTAVSKGVWIDDRMIDASARAARNVLEIGENSNFLDVLPPHTVGHLFLAGVPTLAAGGILSLARFAPREFGRLVEATEASIAIVLPVMFRMLETHGIEGLRPLRTLGTGASTVPVTMPARALRMGIERFVHMFGMTEALTPVFAHATTDADAPDATALRGPLGDTEARFADDGELLLRGSAITRGYHADPHATAAAFDEDGFFRTGDLFDRSDDLVHFKGRRDELVKINDVTVSPTLTEAVVGSLPGVAACAVGAVRRRSGADRLVALVKGTETSAAEICAACRSGVDAHQVPAQVVFVDDVPLNAMGKVDRQRAAELFRGLAAA